MLLNSEHSKDGRCLWRAEKVDHKTEYNDREERLHLSNRIHKHPSDTAVETREASQNRLKRGTDTFTAMVHTLTLSSLLVDHYTKNIRKYIKYLCNAIRLDQIDIHNYYKPCRVYGL